MLRDDNLVSKNLLSLLGSPQKNSERVYEIPIAALPLEPVLDPALGFVGFPQAEVFKLDPKAKHDAVLGYDFFNFQGKDLLLSAQKWHVVYEELAMAACRLRRQKARYVGPKYHRPSLILMITLSRVCKKTFSTSTSLSESVDQGIQDHT